jgi:CheY-like chemotaxis protein
MTQGKAILIIDDDPGFVAATQGILTTAHYQVAVVENMEEGMKAIEKQRPDLILPDVMMERSDDGLNPCYELKHDDRSRDIPVIIIATVTEVAGLKFSPDTDGEYLEADDCLQKPIGGETLLARVARLI